MLISIKNIIGKNILSLETGHPVAQLESAIVNPHNLRIVAFYVSGPMIGFSPAILFSEDIREFSQIGAIIDSSDRIIELNEDMVRLNEIINYGFSLENIKVVQKNKQKIGRVRGYAVDILNFSIRQLFVNPGFWKSFLSTNLIIGREQIIAIDNEKITIKDTVIKNSANKTISPLNTNLEPIENPFRKPKPATENIKIQEK